MIETGFGKEFSEPPSVTVSASRTNCEACQEPLDPNVMHKCHGNKEYQAPVISSTEITEACPSCKSRNVSVLICLWSGASNTHVVVCKDCRTFLSGETPSLPESIERWNRHARLGPSGNMDMSTGIPGEWPKWRAALPGDDERANVTPSEAQPRHPDLTNYQGVCPACKGKQPDPESPEDPCAVCGGKGVIG